MKRVTLFLASLLLSAAAHAIDCEKANTQLESNECYSAQYKQDDQLLNQTYKKVLSLATPEQQNLLRQAQLAWIKVRDADCKFISSGSEGGTIAPMIHSICLSDRTKERTAFLESLTQCEEGDMSCPLPPQQN
ncbi:lysozyme inhibitor LprI family protein [Cedecea colo]|uniref:DUF1311 domain-containing protein n=1 Tax=Cedecea colo TaxID=2552946 RepID=A0ABX0VJ29_9ENTR|nr:lysozyme inhibitor LprI family protein [Cedecea colo]NIY47049.1 DUF1311 domain-containing protein [Cedecea colo]